ncbi:MAG TPA: FtsX-like permease family protein [Thermoanaerobaculia bacterium]
MSARLLRRSSRRQLSRHPWQMSLAVLGVALGVAVVVSIELANASARRAFSLSTEAVTGRATHQVIGGPDGLPDTAFRDLTLADGLGGEIAMAPVVEGYGVLPTPSGKGGRLLRILGVDPFSEPPFRPYLKAGGGDRGAPVNLGALMTRPGAGVLAAATARELGVKTGGSFRLRVGGVERTVELAGVLEPQDEGSRRALADLLVMDIAAAQEVLGRSGKIDRIDLIVPEGPEGNPGEKLLARAAAVLPPGAQILRSSSRSQTTEEMTRAFRLNLTALSLLALVCGVFLIYNTMTFSVVQRRTLIGTLRALGVTRGQIFSLVLGEAAVVGVLGTALGLGAGVLLGRGLVRLVTQTINDLYFVLTVRELSLPALTLLEGAVLGIGATLLAAAAPAWEATQAPPRAVLTRSILESQLRQALPKVTLAGVGLLLGGLLLLIPRNLIISFSGLFCVILGCALLAPVVTVLLMRLLRRPMGALFGVLGRMAAGGVVAALSRTAVAIAALVIAVSVTVGIGVMIDSFRQTLIDWLEHTLQDDIYVTVPSRGGGFAGADLDPEVVRKAAAVPGVVRVETLRRMELTTPDGPVRMISLGTDLWGLSRHELQQGDAATAWPAVLNSGAVVVSEPFSRRHGVDAGATIRLPTDAGLRPFHVVGVYSDFASDQGLVLMSGTTYARFWHDPLVSGFSVNLAPGVDADQAIARLQAAEGDATLFIRSNRALKKISLDIFDRTFRITAVLRLLAGLVAFIGILSALMALQLERARELGVLRATGATPAQVWQLVTSQTGLLGLAAGLLSVPVGLALAAIMIFVINRRSFGWTIHMLVTPAVLLEALGLALTAALLAGLYPAWKMARTSPALALREE